ncbi:MAG: hypothetical protein ACREH5_00150, partial [Candidatus Omnitrophota bacterium]
GWWTLAKRVREKVAGTELEGASFLSILQYGDPRLFKKVYPNRGAASANGSAKSRRKARRPYGRKRIYRRRIQPVEQFVLLDNGMRTVTVTVTDGKKTWKRLFHGARIDDIVVEMRGRAKLVKV